jgi:Tfp pilus assembly protein PilV
MNVNRRGVSLVELAAAAVLLGMVLTVCAQFLRAIATQRRGLDARRVAMQAVGNVMERLAARPWDEVTAEGAKAIELSEAAAEMLPGGGVEVEVLRPDDQPLAKRVTVVLRWEPEPGQPPRSVRLVAWRYRAAND